MVSGNDTQDFETYIEAKKSSTESLTAKAVNKLLLKFPPIFIYITSSLATHNDVMVTCTCLTLRVGSTERGIR